MLSKATLSWSLVQDSPEVEGAAFAESFEGNVSMGADTRTETEGLSVRLMPGFNYHFWSANGRHTFDPSDVGGVLVTFQARLVKEVDAVPLDATEVRILAGAGGDYWRDESAPWAGFTTNGDFAIGRMKHVTDTWRAFNAHTIDAELLASVPPPLE